MSEDLIKRSDAIDAIHSYWKGELSKMPTTDSEYGEVIDGDYNTLLKHNKELSTRINDIPSADRPQGKWIEHKEKTIVRNNNFIDFFPTEYECSNCGLRRATYFINSPLSNFCPNCGADMREREGE